MLDLVGFDTATPTILSQFATGAFSRRFDGDLNGESERQGRRICS